MPSVPAVPTGFGLALDPSVRRIDEGRVLVGGSPIRLVRLTERGAALVDRWARGAPVGTGRGAATLARRLLDGGLAHPRPDGPGPHTSADVTVVVPCRDAADGLDRTLAALSGPPRVRPARIVVVDDGSVRPTTVTEVAARHGAEVEHRPRSGGPSAARNAGLATVTTPLVAFIDCDVEAGGAGAGGPHGTGLGDVLAVLLAHLADPAVAAVAPRVVAGPGDGGTLACYEAERSPLDLGPQEARVAPRTRVAYVPSTFLLARVDALRAVGGFDEHLRFGEDVDLVWRLTGAGHTVRYEPTAVATHPPRPDLASWLRQRFDYGTAAAPLEHRHPGAVPPVVLSPWTAAAWSLAVAGHPIAATAVTAFAAARLTPRLRGLSAPAPEAARLVVGGALHAWRPLATAVTRSWWPVAVAASLASRRARRATVAAALAPTLADWAAGDHHLDPLRYAIVHLADDVAYGTGVWAGCRRTGDWSALLPDLTASGAHPTYDQRAQPADRADPSTETRPPP
ncbi:MAG: mycofactocin biosynthesis glycosyltransferase MftF [Acidimicrobiales bacterium]